MTIKEIVARVIKECSLLDENETNYAIEYEVYDYLREIGLTMTEASNVTTRVLSQYQTNQPTS